MGFESERRIALQAADSLSLRQFLGYGLHEATPDHSTLSKTRKRLALEAHEEVFGWVLGRLREAGLTQGGEVAVDATTLEANAALKGLVRKATGEAYREFVLGLAEAAGECIESEGDLIPFRPPAEREKPVERGVGEPGRRGRTGGEDEGRDHAPGIQGGARRWTWRAGTGGRDGAAGRRRGHADATADAGSGRGGPRRDTGDGEGVSQRRDAGARILQIGLFRRRHALQHIATIPFIQGGLCRQSWRMGDYALVVKGAFQWIRTSCGQACSYYRIRSPGLLHRSVSSRAA